MNRNSRGARIAGVLLSCALAGACATAPPLSEGTRRLPPVVELASVPFHPQTGYQCGPAALAMVLNAAGADVSVDALIDEVYVPALEGSLQPEMLASPRRHGRTSHRLEGTFDSMLAEVAGGNPVVVLQNLSLPVWPRWHYAVVVGYDLPRRELVLHTGTDRSRRISMGRFHNTWKRSGHWAMVVPQPGALPVTVDRLQAAEDIAAFERAAGVGDASQAAWSAVLERWPDYALAWFAFGNGAYARGETGSALAAYREATRLDPGFGAAWLNLGLLLAESGDRSGSLLALRRAAEIAGPWQEPARRSLDRILKP